MHFFVFYDAKLSPCCIKGCQRILKGTFMQTCRVRSQAVRQIVRWKKAAQLARDLKGFEADRKMVLATFPEEKM